MLFRTFLSSWEALANVLHYMFPSSSLSEMLKVVTNYAVDKATVAKHANAFVGHVMFLRQTPLAPTSSAHASEWRTYNIWWQTHPPMSWRLFTNALDLILCILLTVGGILMAFLA